MLYVEFPRSIHSILQARPVRAAVVSALLLLSGCAELNAELASVAPPPKPLPMKLALGEDFDSVKNESKSTHNGPLIEISSIGSVNFKGSVNVPEAQIAHEYDPYAFFQPKRDFIEQGSKQQILVFRDSRPVLVTDSESFQGSMEPLLEADRQRALYGNDYDLAIRYSKDLGTLPTRAELAALHDEGIGSSNDLQEAVEQFQKLRGLYSNMAEFRSFLQDRLVASRKHIPLIRVVRARKKREAEKAAKERAAYVRKYPYEAVMTCGHVGVNVGQCFIGPAQVLTELELKNGNTYHMYRFSDVNSAGKYGAEGFVIPLRRHFSLKAQNALNFYLLNVTIRNTRTHSVLFQKSAGQFGVIGVEN